MALYVTTSTASFFKGSVNDIMLVLLNCRCVSRGADKGPRERKENALALRSRYLNFEAISDDWVARRRWWNQVKLVRSAMGDDDIPELHHKLTIFAVIGGVQGIWRPRRRSKNVAKGRE